MMFEFYERDSVGEADTLLTGMCTYVRVELIARPIEAQNNCARIVGRRDYGDIISPWTHRWWRFLVQ
jgi:hypothetical protein